ncbi:hypothetical protein GAPWKB30_1219 [Gilliamella apicola]|nr:hypothetical protein GAPWKB30_1219 [Gilliamella apicola]
MLLVPEHQFQAQTNDNYFFIHLIFPYLIAYQLVCFDLWYSIYLYK